MMKAVLRKLYLAVELRYFVRSHWDMVSESLFVPSTLLGTVVQIWEQFLAQET